MQHFWIDDEVVIGGEVIISEFQIYFSQEEQERLRQEILAVKEKVILCSHVMIYALVWVTSPFHAYLDLRQC